MSLREGRDPSSPHPLLPVPPTPRQLEQQVESAHAQQLKHRCIDERRYQQNLMYRGKITGNRDLMQQAESLPMTSCNEFQKFMGQQ